MLGCPSNDPQAKLEPPAAGGRCFTHTDDCNAFARQACCRPIRGPLTRSVAMRPFCRPGPLPHAYRIRRGPWHAGERSVDSARGLATNWCPPSPIRNDTPALPAPEWQPRLTAGREERRVIDSARVGVSGGECVLWAEGMGRISSGMASRRYTHRLRLADPSEQLAPASTYCEP
jgi:hypothetical protein